MIETPPLPTRPSSPRQPLFELPWIVRLNVGLRATLELGIVVGLAVWGLHAGSSLTSRWLLAVAAPLLAFGFWGAIDFRQAGRYAEPLRLGQELAIDTLVALGFSAASLPILGWILAGLAVLHYGLVYTLGQRLVKR